MCPAEIIHIYKTDWSFCSRSGHFSLTARVYMISSVCVPFLPQLVPTVTDYTKGPSGGEVKASAANRKNGNVSEHQ